MCLSARHADMQEATSSPKSFEVDANRAAVALVAVGSTAPHPSSLWPPQDQPTLLRKGRGRKDSEGHHASLGT